MQYLLYKHEEKTLNTINRKKHKLKKSQCDTAIIQQND